MLDVTESKPRKYHLLVKIGFCSSSVSTVHSTNCGADNRPVIRVLCGSSLHLVHPPPTSPPLPHLQQDPENHRHHHDECNGEDGGALEPERSIKMFIELSSRIGEGFSVGAVGDGGYVGVKELVEPFFEVVGGVHVGDAALDGGKSILD